MATEEDRGSEAEGCIHPLEEIEDAIAHIGDPLWGYCYGCNKVVHLENGVWTSHPFSVNGRVEHLFGRRRTDVVTVDLPCELGYMCPVCKVPARKDDGSFDERLHWSEYNGFLWCSVCNKDYPSALCVPFEGEKDSERDWELVGPEDAIKVFLDTVEHAVEVSRGRV